MSIPIAKPYPALVLALTLVAGPAAADKRYGPGVTDIEIKIGQTMPYSGPLSGYANIAKAEAAYFEMVNAAGGVNGRKIRLISLDDGFNPAKTIEQTKKLLEQEEVLLLFGSLGTATNSAIHKYVNAKGVPHLFLLSGASKWADPQRFPWTMAWVPAYSAEAKIYARYLLQVKPEAKVAVLYQNDDMGKDYLRGFKDGLGEAAAKMIVSEASYEPAEPTVDSQVFSLKGAGADALVLFATAKAAAQALRKTHDIGWQPLTLVTYTSSSVETVLKPIGLEKVAGIVSSTFVKDPSDPQWGDDAAMREWQAWMRRYYPEGNARDIQNVIGYSLAQTLVQVLKQCGDDLSRESVMREASNLKRLQLPMLLPGIQISTGPYDYLPIEQLQPMRFDGQQWVRFGAKLDATLVR